VVAGHDTGTRVFPGHGNVAGANLLHVTDAGAISGHGNYTATFPLYGSSNVGFLGTVPVPLRSYGHGTITAAISVHDTVTGMIRGRGSSVFPG